jgi:hypothetical protein
LNIAIVSIDSVIFQLSDENATSQVFKPMTETLKFLLQLESEGKLEAVQTNKSYSRRRSDGGWKGLRTFQMIEDEYFCEAVVRFYLALR